MTLSHTPMELEFDVAAAGTGPRLGPVHVLHVLSHIATHRLSSHSQLLDHRIVQSCEGAYTHTRTPSSCPRNDDESISGLLARLRVAGLEQLTRCSSRARSSQDTPAQPLEIPHLPRSLFRLFVRRILNWMPLVSSNHTSEVQPLRYFQTSIYWLRTMEPISFTKDCQVFLESHLDNGSTCLTSRERMLHSRGPVSSIVSSSMKLLRKPAFTLVLMGISEPERYVLLWNELESTRRNTGTCLEPVGLAS